MARKASDMVMLLRARGKGRGRGGRSGLLGRIGDSLVRLLGGSGPRGKSARSAGSSVPGWLALAVALACFAGGYVVRGYIAPSDFTADGGTGLNAGPRSPGMIETETEPLSGWAFFVAAYVDIEESEARQRAFGLARHLVDIGVEKARPYRYPGAAGPLWVVVVYYDGATEMRRTIDQLRALPHDVPDPVFVGYRKSEKDWPKAFEIR